MTAAHNFSLESLYSPIFLNIKVHRKWCCWRNFPFYYFKYMQNIILNMTSRRTNTPVYSQNNLSNQRLEAHASVDWITFIDPCSGWSCQVIIPEKCSGVQNQHLLMPTSNNGLLLNIYYVQAYTTNFMPKINSNYRPLRKSLSKKEQWLVSSSYGKPFSSL